MNNTLKKIFIAFAAVAIFGSIAVSGYQFGNWLAARQEPVQIPKPDGFFETMDSRSPWLAAVVPHHDVVKQLRADMLSALSEEYNPETIILLSPNHFNAGSGPIITTSRTWKLANGESDLFPDTALLEILRDQLPFVTEEDAVFENEHGIKNILSDLHEAWPNAKVVPLVIKTGVTTEQLDQLVQVIQTDCTTCGVIASVDMSHYQPARLADIHDIKTLRALHNLDTEDVLSAEVDSPESLYALIRWINPDQNNTDHTFVTCAHTNSGELENNFITETTSHIIGYYRFNADPAPVCDAKRSEHEDTVTFSFAGDMMLGREIGYQFQANNFTDLISDFGDRVFWGTDIAWANVEGPISDQTIVQYRQPDHLNFLFSKEAVNALTKLRINTAGLANNHLFDRGEAGLRTTEQMLEQVGLQWHGHPREVNEDSVERFTQGKTTVALIAVHALNQGFTTGIEELIRQEKDAGNAVIVLPHWGNEYQTTHSANQEQYAQAWVDAGADMIIGMHPHVVQDAELLEAVDESGKSRKALVIYSLGNFVFDQTFSKETQLGLLVSGFIDKKQIDVRLFPLEAQKLKPRLSRDANRQLIIDRICENIPENCSTETGVISLSR